MSALAVSKVEVIMYSDDGNGFPQLGHATFSDGKVYGFFMKPHKDTWLFHTVGCDVKNVSFHAPKRAKALQAAIDDGSVVCKHPYFAS